MPTPGSVLNISPAAGRNHFKVQYAPDPPGSTVIEKSQADIAGGFDLSPYFTGVGSDAQLQVRVDAATTSGTSYPRSELREMDLDGTTEMAFDTAIGTHWVRLRGVVTHVPPDKPTVIVAQLHGGSSDQIAVCTQLSGGVIKMLCRVNGTSSGQPNLANPYTVGTSYEIMIKVVAGTTYVHYNDMANPVITTTAVSSTGASYFKAGCYSNSNASTETDDTEYAQTRISFLEHWHTGWPTPVAGGAGAPPPPRWRRRRGLLVR